jgi:hypothetical protein
MLGDHINLYVPGILYSFKMINKLKIIFVIVTACFIPIKYCKYDDVDVNTQSHDKFHQLTLTLDFDLLYLK